MKYISMLKNRQGGIFYLIIGIFIPSIFYPFIAISPEAMQIKALLSTKGFPMAYEATIRDYEIVIVKGRLKENGGRHFIGRIAVPYKYILGAGILFILIGSCMTFLTVDKNDNNRYFLDKKRSFGNHMNSHELNFINFLDERISNKLVQKNNAEMGSRTYDLLKTEIAELEIIRLEFIKKMNSFTR